MPAALRALLESRLSGNGFTQRELGLLGATIDLLVQDHLDQQLRAAYTVLGRNPATALLEDDAMEVMALYLMRFQFGHDLSDNSEVIEDRRPLQRGEQEVRIWRAMHEWLRVSASPKLKQWTFADVSQVLQRLGKEQVEQVVSKSQHMKHELATLKGGSSGRVILKEVYASRSTRSWLMDFTEREEFLRQLGVLDESDPAEPRLIVANYLLSPSRCEGVWRYYAVCPVNECEFLMVSLLKAIARPEATPGRILEAVSLLSRDSLVAQQSFPEPLAVELHSIAQQHGGKVPLHGQPFRQWMHFAFPLECPTLHPVGKLKPMDATAFEVATGSQAYYSEEELDNFTVNQAEGQCLGVKCPEEMQVEDHSKLSFSSSGGIASSILGSGIIHSLSFGELQWNNIIRIGVFGSMLLATLHLMFMIVRQYWPAAGSCKAKVQ